MLRLDFETFDKKLNKVIFQKDLSNYAKTHCGSGTLGTTEPFLGVFSGILKTTGDVKKSHSKEAVMMVVLVFGSTNQTKPADPWFVGFRQSPLTRP